MSEELINIRKYISSDLTSLYKICLETGDSGKNATHIYTDPDLLGHFYAAPYAVLEPELTFIATLDDVPSGYILGTKNSEQFYQRCETDWFPELRKRYKLKNANDSSPDSNIIKAIHNGHVLKPELVNYPAHLHIDLLPNTQGKGLGRKMINTFIEELRSLKVSAVHLEVGKKNLGAIAFYKHMGFHEIIEYEYSIAYGLQLS